MRESGFTILELLIVIAIIAIISASLSPAIDQWLIKKGFRSGVKELANELAAAKIEALTRSTTSRVFLQSNGGGSYSITTFASATPVSTCLTTGSWTQVSTKTLELPSLFQITGSSGYENTCFYRDQSASGTTYNITQTDGLSNYGSASITITISTGYMDIIIN